MESKLARMQPADSRDAPAVPSVLPEGWYFVAPRRLIERKGLIEKTWLGQEIVAWLGAQDRICVADAICPHMGSYLGPSAGGCVVDGRLVCPFHKFAYDTAGQCVATPTPQGPPRNARLAMVPTQEISGMVFGWWSSLGRPPQWPLPPLEDDDGHAWSELDLRQCRFTGHPQDTTENVADMTHLAQVHGYQDVRPGEVTTDGAYLSGTFDFSYERRYLGAKISVSPTVRVLVAGLGYSLVQHSVTSLDLHGRFWVLATPVDETELELTLAVRVREIVRPQRPIVGLRFLPTSWRKNVMLHAIASEQVRFVSQDIPIWSGVHYRPQPILNAADRFVPIYRRYAAQFYPEGFRPVPARPPHRPLGGRPKWIRP